MVLGRDRNPACPRGSVRIVSATPSIVTADTKPSAPILFADREHEERPVCVPCFLRWKRSATDPQERERWQECEQHAQETWAKLPAARREQLGITDESCGWLLLLLDAMKWPLLTKGRCWRCAHNMVIAFRQLIEETQGADAAQDYAAKCKHAATAADGLALEMEAIGFQKLEFTADLDRVRGDFKEARDRHLATLEIVLREPDALMVKTLWQQLHRALSTILRSTDAAEDAEPMKYDPLTRGPTCVRHIAVALLQVSQMAAVTGHNFAGVVQAHSSSVGRRPERLALVVAYQWAQQMSPPMGYGELARVLFGSGVTKSLWGGDATSLEANIKQAVRHFKDRGPIQTQNYGS